MLRSIRSLLWFLLIGLVVGGFIVLKGRSDRRKLDAATLAMFYLTPESLTQTCGAPDQDLTGRIVDDDGIRELQYTDSSGRSIAFRFIQDFAAPGKWNEIGAWADVQDSSSLGGNIEDLDAVSHMPCLLQTSQVSAASSTAPLQSTMELAFWNGGPVPYRNISLQEQEQGGRTVPDQPMPPYTPPPFSGPQLNLKPNLGRFPPPDGGSGSSGDGDGSQGPKPVVVPCISSSSEGADLDVCELVSDVKFLRDLQTTFYSKSAYTSLDEMTTKLTGRDFRVVNMPALTLDRAQAVKAIFQLEVQVVNAVAARLQVFEASLTPFQWDTAEDKARKMDMVRQDEKERRSMWAQAIESSRPAKSMTFVTVPASHSASSEDSSATTKSSDNYRETRMQMNDNQALRQLNTVHNNGKWDN